MFLAFFLMMWLNYKKSIYSRIEKKGFGDKNLDRNLTAELQKALKSKLAVSRENFQYFFICTVGMY